MEAKQIGLSEELKVLAKKIDDVKRDNWSLSDESIEAYLIGKDTGKEHFVNSVVESYVEKLNKIQDSVESIYDKLNKNNVECQKAFLRMNPLNFTVVFIIPHKDFHDKVKRKLCYTTSIDERRNINDNDVLTTFRFTCEDNLNTENLRLNGYNATFG